MTMFEFWLKILWKFVPNDPDGNKCSIGLGDELMVYNDKSFITWTNVDQSSRTPWSPFISMD